MRDTEVLAAVKEGGEGGTEKERTDKSWVGKEKGGFREKDRERERDREKDRESFNLEDDDDDLSLPW